MLVVHRAERSDVLVEALGDLLREPLADPLQAEVVSVPTRGVERWLTQRLSHRLGVSGDDGGAGRGDGVCANLDFPFPGRLVGDALSAACGVDRDTDPWRVERAVWPLLEILDASITEPWLSTVASHLGVAADGTRDEARAARRFSTARHVTDLFDAYAVHRPAMVRAWAAGDDVDAAGERVGDAFAWQPELWRRLRTRIGQASPAERLDEACAHLRDEPGVVDLPGRLAMFGLTRLPASYLDVLRVLAVHRDVHLFLLHPSAALWDKVAAVPGTGEAVRRRLDPTAESADNPLLRSWGRDAREMQLVIAPAGDGAHGATDVHHPLVAAEPATLLHRVQESVRDDVAPPGEPLPGAEDVRPVLDAADRSIQVHACHGRARQVEVLRDAILHLLVDDPTLEARDVIVMCPDIETFAPLIHAAFGAGAEAADPLEDDDGSPPATADLRVRLADRSLRQTNPVLGAVSALLALADSRVTATHVLDFAGREPVRRRFRFDDDNLARLKEWVSATGIRWGLDGDHRKPYKLDAVGQNTWDAGLDRVLVGVAVAEEEQRLIDGVLPLDDVESGSIDLAGRFAEMVDRLRTLVTAMQRPMTVGEWAKTIGDGADALMSVADRDEWQRNQLLTMLDDLISEAGETDGHLHLSLPEVRALLADRLRGRPTRANFRTGHLTVCTLVPMRSVPHRVVCLLGLDDDAFPRKAERDGDDLVAADPFVGDGDGRSEDRQLLLDALLAATERLVITYSGNDERTNAPLPPSVPVGELLDVVDATVRLDGGGQRRRAREAVVVHHPLQPFDPRNFEPGRLGSDDPWSFDAVTLEGARSLRDDRPPATPFLGAPLPARDRAEVVELDNLVKFVQHPVRAFLRQRLGISLGDFSDDILDEIPVELDNLQKWSVGDRMLADRLAGADTEACLQAERARGLVPPSALADGVLVEVQATVELLVAAAVERCGEATAVDSVEVSVRLDDGRLLVGTVAGIVGRGGRRSARDVTYSRLAAKHRVGAWARFLALCAGRPGDGIDVVTIGRASGNKNVAVSRFAPIGEHRARRLLHGLVDLYDRGMCEPLPLYCATSAAYAQAVVKGRDPVADAVKKWESGMFPGEEKDAEHQLVHGGTSPLDALLAIAPCEGEDGEGWDGAEPSRFGRYAMRLWSPLLDLEQWEEK